MDLSSEEVRHIVETLAYGNTDDVFELIYGNDMLTKAQLSIPLRLLSELHDPTSASAISVVEAGYQEPFWMLILKMPWLNHERAGPHYPLLLAHQHGVPKIAGNVMPWNEISQMFTEDQKNANTRLVTWWAIWLKKYQQTK